MKAFNKEGQPVELADGAILPDGYSIRVPSYLVDGVPQPMTSNTRIVDSAGRPAGSRPGFLYDNDANDDAAQQTYAERSRLLQDSWRGTAWTNAASNLRGAWHNMASPSPPVDRTTAESARETYKTNLQSAWRTPAAVADQASLVTDSRPITQEDLERDRERRKLELSNAWKTCKGVGMGPGSHG